MAGFVIENILSGRLKQFFYEDLAELNKEEDVIRLDVRTSNEYLKGHLEGFVNIPVDELRKRISKFVKGKKVYVIVPKWDTQLYRLPFADAAWF